MADNPALEVVIPIYNEEKNVAALLTDWHRFFRESSLQCRFILINDGSTDASGAILQSLAATIPGLSVHAQPNAGHGPSILTGYRMATHYDMAALYNNAAEWVFQIDSDHQLDTAAFTTLWNHRDQYDLLLGERKEKKATLARKVVSLFSGWIVRLLFSGQVNDVNSPYRLMRSSCLQLALQRSPPDTFAPNILLTSWFIFSKEDLYHHGGSPER